MGDKTKRGIFIALFVVLLLPLLQQQFSFITSGRLFGWFTTTPDPDFTWEQWFNGSYQEVKTKFYNDNLGLRPDLIRLNNQLDFSLFKKFRSDDAILGYDTCLLPPEYINPYLGKDFIGYDAIHQKLRKLRAIQDTLARMGKSVVLVFSPCKAYYYAEDIPKEYLAQRTGPANYEGYRKAADSFGINNIDFNAWFVAMKPTAREILYPRQGYHWSVYGSLIAADSFVTYIEKLRHIHMPHPVWKNVEHTTKPRYSDDDLALTLNFIYPACHEVFAYPQVSYPMHDGLVKPKIVYEGDSFIFLWKMLGFMDGTNTDWQIWYYNRDIYTSTDDIGVNSNKPVAASNWKHTLLASDCIVVMYTAHTLKDLGGGFIEDAYSYFYPKG